MKQILFSILLLVFIIAPASAFAQSSEDVAALEEERAALEDLRAELDDLSGEYDDLVGDDFVPEQIDVVTNEERATVINIISETEIDGAPQMVFEVETKDGERYTIDTSQAFIGGLRYKIKEGTDIYIQTIHVDGELVNVFLVDIVRYSSIFWIVLLFAAIIIAVGYWRGVASLLGLMITFVVLFGFLFPAIIKGADPVLSTVFASIIILAVNMHVAHGFSKRTLYAYASTVVGLLFVVFFAKFFVAVTNLSGLASEEMALLVLQSETIAIPAGILLASIILGAVGVLDDIAITQTETVAELREANPDLSSKELFTRAMRVGRHHIASTVNTLVLAYAGAALPLLLLFMITYSVDAIRFVNNEIVVEEIVRTLAGTTALVLTVPIATWFATFSQKK